MPDVVFNGLGCLMLQGTPLTLTTNSSLKAAFAFNDAAGSTTSVSEVRQLLDDLNILGVHGCRLADKQQTPDFKVKYDGQLRIGGCKGCDHRQGKLVELLWGEVLIGGAHSEWTFLAACDKSTRQLYSFSVSMWPGYKELIFSNRKPAKDVTYLGGFAGSLDA